MFPERYCPRHYFPDRYCARQPAGAPPTLRTLSGVLVDRNNIARANVTGLNWHFWDDPNLAATDHGTLNTDANGGFTITLTHSGLGIGQIGWFEVDDSDGTVTQNPAESAFYGPVTVS